MSFFLNNDTSPKLANKSVNESFNDMRNTFVKFFRTFEDKHINIYGNNLLQDFIKIQIETNNIILDYIFNSNPIYKNELSKNTNDQSSINPDLSKIFELILALDSSKKIEQDKNFLSVKFPIIDYNTKMDLIKFLIKDQIYFK